MHDDDDDDDGGIDQQKPLYFSLTAKQLSKFSPERREDHERSTIIRYPCMMGI